MSPAGYECVHFFRVVDALTDCRLGAASTPSYASDHRFSRWKCAASELLGIARDTAACTGAVQPQQAPRAVCHQGAASQLSVLRYSTTCTGHGFVARQSYNCLQLHLGNIALLTRSGSAEGWPPDCRISGFGGVRCLCGSRWHRISIDEWNCVCIHG